MQRHEVIHKNAKQILLNNFLGGIAWGLGATVGLAIIFALLGIILSRINLIPVVGKFVGEVVLYVLQSNPNINLNL